MSEVTRRLPGSARRDAVAFLFCDLVGSTALLSRIGEEASNELRRDVFATLRRPVEAVGGTEVKTQGDGLMAAFETVDRAIGCGLAMLRGIARLAVRDPDLPLAIRVGVSSGDAVHEEGDWFGAPVVEAARLCSSAGSGELFMPNCVAAAAREPWPTESVGPLELKGFPEPLPSVRVSPGTISVRPGVPVPPELDTSLDPDFLDRHDRQAMLCELVDRAVGGTEASIVLIGGDAGTGRTRLASEVAQHVASIGGTVLFGRSTPADKPLAPLAQALRWLALATPPAVLRDRLGAHAAALAAMVPAIHRRLDGVARLSTPDIDDRIAAVCGVLCDAPAPTPLLLVLDDLHHADAATLAVLIELSHRIGPLVVLATHRPPLGTSGHALQVTIDKLDGLPSVSTIPLAPFDTVGAAHLLTAVCPGQPVTDSDLSSVMAETGGSAMRIVEIARRLDALDPRVASLESAVLATCPYKGLEPFDAADAPRFYGRGSLIADVVTKVSSNRFTGLVGASGSGKSSLLRAGVLPALDTSAVVCSPGAHPLAALAHAAQDLGPAPGVIAVDQLEECFTLCDDHRERIEFLDALTAPGPHRVVAAVRGDFYAHFAVHPATARALERSTVLVGPMVRADLETVVEQPALDAGLTLEHGLVDLVVTDVLDEPGGLPLLSHAMRETWRRHQGQVLTVADYRSTGGARAAIARSADLAFTTELDGEEQAIARAMFLRLTELGDGSADTRRRVPLDELLAAGGDPATTAKVLAVLTATRLVIADESSVEVAHEALIREWPRLRAWLDEDRDALRAQAHIGHATRDWEAAGRSDDDLYSGGRLEDAAERAARGSIHLTPAEHAFLDASASQRSADERRERRSRRRLRRLLGVAVIGLAVALVAGGVAVAQRGEARDQAAEARRQADLADQRRIAAEAVALVSSRPDTAALLAVEAGRRGRLPETDAALATALLRFPAIVRHLSVDGADLRDPVTSPDQHMLAAASGSAIVLFETGSGSPAGRLEVDAEIRDLTFVSETVVAAATPDWIELWDTTSSSRTGVPLGVPLAQAIAGSPDGTRLAVLVEDGTVHVVDLQGNELTAPFRIYGSAGSIAWHPDGMRVITGGTGSQGSSESISDDPSGRAVRSWPTGHSIIELRDTSSGTLQLLAEVNGMSAEVSVDPTGQRAIAASSSPGAVSLVDLNDGSVLELADGREFGVATATALADGTAVYVNSDGTVLHHRTDGDMDQPIDPGPGDASAFDPIGVPLETPATDNAQVAPGPDDTVFVTVSSGGIVQVALDGSGALLEAVGDHRVDTAGAFAPDGTQIAVDLDGSGVGVIDRASGALTAGPFRRGGSAHAWPTSRQLLVSNLSSEVSVIDPTDPDAEASIFNTGLGNIDWVDASGDGGVALVGSFRSAEVAILDIERRTVVRRVDPGGPGPFLGRFAALSPDGKRIALVTAAGRLEIQDSMSGQVLDQPEVGAGVPTAPGYSPDGDTLAVGTSTGAVAFYDGRRRQVTANVLRGQRAAVAQVDITAAGIVVVASVDDTVRMFDPAGAPLGEAFRVATESSPVVAGAAAAIEDPAGRLAIVELEATRWPAIARAWAGRALTDAERREFRLELRRR